MSEFRFRLERLLELRRAREDVAQRDFASARRASEEEARRLEALLAEEEEGREAARRLRRGAIDLAALGAQEGWRGALEGRLRSSRERLRELGRAEAGKRQALVEARKAVKVLERFRERKRAEWSREQEGRERRALDEAARGARETA